MFINAEKLYLSAVNFHQQHETNRENLGFPRLQV
ncbi:hypothetical protein N39L_47260 [Limnospira platensis NIES-39]|uniref:Transposase n=1 Tax=Limnospira platensis NIES-46 TaxID=1236695 RepID=A0A5M3T199_LIMPL|nr:hypothetical protein N39L_47260 [Arthrospira platensis NIES-39]GCE93433.1 hypothetical protein NIES46_14830 [Arthrospira platensis NIES-46]